MELQKLTTYYHKHQDRLCIDGQNAEGEIIRLWLTYRLLRQLIPALLNLVTPAADTNEKSATLAEWALTNARAKQKPAKAVTPPPTSAAPGVGTTSPPSWLISAIALKKSPKRAVMVFRISANKAVATIAFTPEHLRQWLSIVFRLWNSAGWPTNEWPNWVKDTAKSAAPEGAVLH